VCVIETERERKGGREREKEEGGREWKRERERKNNVMVLF